MTTRNDNGPQGYCGFEVGQHVVCVNDDFTAWLVSADLAQNYAAQMQFPVKDVVYTVREIEVDETVVCLRLREIFNPKLDFNEGISEMAFNATRFRPLPKLRVEDFLAASTPKDVVGRVPA